MTGSVLRIERSSIHDGPGLRTVVFLKGCPLRCLWCSTPESQSGMPQKGQSAQKCTGCGACIAACPKGAIAIAEGRAHIDRDRCDECLACVSACPNEAYTLYGRAMTVEAVMREVLKDEVFYFHSGGGVTLSGGEPLAQPLFAAAILARCRQSGIHTALETSLWAPFEAVAQVVPHVDHLFVDIKHGDRDAHHRLTGVDNTSALENLARLAEAGFRGTLVIRIPLIPGINDSDDNLRATAQIAAGLPGLLYVELLPYHRLGLESYRRLGLTYALPGIKTPTPAHMLERAALMEAAAPGLKLKA